MSRVIIGHQSIMTQARTALIGEAVDAQVSDFFHESPHKLPTKQYLHTITLLIPLLQNSNKLGIRFPTSPRKIRQTLRELQAHFSGFTLSFGLGWCADDEMWDPHLCVDFDAESTLDLQRYIVWWKKLLEDRFHQRSIYMKLSSPISWV
jgi:hypothetical protein